VDTSNQRGSAVTDIQYFTTGTTNTGDKECCILVATSSRLMQFTGVVNFASGEVPVFQTFFSMYDSSPPKCIESDCDEVGPRKLSLFYNLKKTKGKLNNPEQFGWLVSSGIYHGNVRPQVSSSEPLPTNVSVLTNQRVIGFPEIPNTNVNRFEESYEDVLDFVMTEFHMLLLYPNCVRAVCSLNDHLYPDDVYLSKFGQLIGLVRDPLAGTIWAYTEKAIFKYKIVQESRDVWQIYLDMNKFELAQSYCKNDATKLDEVYSRQAEHAFEKGQYQESALYYAITQKPFEEVALKFISHGRESALRAFLHKKLSNLSYNDTTQVTMLTTWLVELYLNQISQLRTIDDRSAQHVKLQNELTTLLSQERFREIYKTNCSALYNLLINHGDIHNYVFFANLMQDYERVVNYYIQKKEYESALDSLTKQNHIPLYYKFSPALMQNIPRRMVDAWISLGKQINPLQLIPSLIKYSQKGQNSPLQWEETIRYLKFTTQEIECTDQAIHNYLLSLYVKYRPTELLSYLKSQGDDMSLINYDIKYALRLCLNQKATAAEGDEIEILGRACVFIYNLLKLYEEAVAVKKLLPWL